MKERSAEECIQRILRDIEKRRDMEQSMDYGDRNAVRRYNAAMERIYSNAHYLGEHYPDEIYLLVDLANSPDMKISICCAHILYRVTNATVEHKRIALSVLKKQVNNPEVPELTRFGICANVEQWEAELGKM